MNKDAALKALAIPAVPIAAILIFILVLGRWGIAAAVCFWFLFVIALLMWGVQQGRRAKGEIRSRIERSGYKVVKMNYRYLRLGPFSLWNTSRSQLVYRVVVQEATGREHIVWVRCGGGWFWNPNTLELIWEGEASPR